MGRNSLARIEIGTAVLAENAILAGFGVTAYGVPSTGLFGADMSKPSPERAVASEKLPLNERSSRLPFNRAFLWVAILAVLAVSVSVWLYLRPGPLRCYQVMKVLDRNPRTVQEALVEMEAYTFDGFAQATLADPELASSSIVFKSRSADAKADPLFWKTHWYGAHTLDEVVKVYVVDTWLRPFLAGC